MKAIKNYESFKKSLLSSTNGTMVESFDSSTIFAGCEYQSYRVYVDDVHYYNMFVIHNFPTNTYDVSLETSNFAVSTMSRVVKTQKAMIESVCRWCYYNYLNTKEISVDSEEYTDRCEETENAECSRGNDVFDGCKTVKEVMEVKQELNARFGKEQYFDTDALHPNKTIIEKIENINHCPNQDTCCIVSPFVHCNYNYKSDSCIKAHKNFIHACEQVHKQMKAKHNPEWHHVSLRTLANIDNDMLEEKRKVYLYFYKKWQEVRKNLRKCRCGYSYERCRCVFRRLLTIALDKKKISKELVEYFDRQISMVNVECGVWSSAVEVATGQHESRKYNRPTLRY